MLAVSKIQLNSNVLAGDKSLTHRALIFSALSDRTCVVTNALVSRDTLATAECLRVLGAKITLCGTTFTVTPWQKPNQNVVLDAQNSGTTARLLAGVLAGLEVSATVVGDKSLSKRPMGRVTEPLRQMGANVTDGDGTFLYKTHGGKLRNTTITQQVVSAQVKSAILIAGALQNGVTYVENTPTRKHTENFLQAFGGKIRCDNNIVTVEKSCFAGRDYNVPNDFSSVAFSLAVALLQNKKANFCNVCVDEERTGMLTVLQQSGAKVFVQNARDVCGESVGDVVVEPSSIGELCATAKQVAFAIDEVPVMSAIALTVCGRHCFYGVSELAHKESNRVEAICSLAKAVGQKATFDGENLVIESDGKLVRHPFFYTFGDHRVAMSAVVLCSATDGAIIDEENFDVSLPCFLQAMGVQPQNYAVVGTNVSASLSPLLICNCALSVGKSVRYNAVNLSENVSDEKLLSVLNAVDGANVTMPFKQRVAKLFGLNEDAVNTVGKNIQPTSTDGYGVTESLANHRYGLTDKNVWIVGAGGVAVTIAKTVAQHTKNVQIFNRTLQKAQFLMQKYGFVGCKNPQIVFVAVPTCSFEDTFTLPESTEIVFNTNYLGKSSVAQRARQRGVEVVEGTEMLFYQGVKSFELWTGQKPMLTYEQFENLLKKDDTK